MTLCPCDSGAELADCCDRYISGRLAAPTAEALMRARYTSYATGKIEFVERTHAPDSRGDFDRKAAEKWSRQSQWKGLRILATKKGAERDSEGIVSFVAAFAQDGKEYHHEEIAHFRKIDGAWMFSESETPNRETYVKTGPDLGRNDPCHCGSGKKFKKCHAKAA